MGQDNAKLAKETGFQKEDIDKLREKYQMLCKDQYGTGPTKKLTKQQFVSHFPSGGQAQADLVFGVFDSGHTGSIDFKEFCMAMSVLMHGTREQKLRFCFDMWDTGNTGSISPAEFKSILVTFNRSFGKLFHSVAQGDGVSTEQRHLTQGQMDAAAERLFHEADTIGDGKLSFEEFRAFTERHPECFAPLETVLKGVKSASGWDWEQAPPAKGPKPSITGDSCVVS
eukprot:TRINITY_DN59975_c0_g1_i1.p1 TRINITY_DN59975_c0_g1~~TRINITY_DN59975_c0_g1_i1.p1  ORF type:complete len:254 (+),score=71.16 TRINITY_DN59975_c0_g1_i1:85-762(+)